MKKLEIQNGEKMIMYNRATKTLFAADITEPFKSFLTVEKLKSLNKFHEVIAETKEETTVIEFKRDTTIDGIKAKFKNENYKLKSTNSDHIIDLAKYKYELAPKWIKKALKNEHTLNKFDNGNWMKRAISIDKIEDKNIMNHKIVKSKTKT